MTAQLVSDLLVAAWITVWVMVGLAVHHAVALIAGVGRQVNDSANGISDNLSSAGDSADRIPWSGHRGQNRCAPPVRRPSISRARAEPQLDRNLAGGAAGDRSRPAHPRGQDARLFLRIRFFRTQVDGDRTGPDAPPASSCWRCGRWPTGRCADRPR